MLFRRNPEKITCENNMAFLINIEKDEIVKVREDKLLETLVYLTMRQEVEVKSSNKEMVQKLIEALEPYSSMFTRDKVFTSDTPFYIVKFDGKEWIICLKLFAKGRWRADNMRITKSISEKTLKSYRDITDRVNQELELFSTIEPVLMCMYEEERKKKEAEEEESEKENEEECSGVVRWWLARFTGLI